MNDLLFYQDYDLRNLEKYNCKTVQQLENQIVSELRRKYDKEIITLSESSDILVVKVEK